MYAVPITTNYMKQWKCRTCKQSFENHKALRLHETHAQCNLNLTCIICSKTYKSSREINRHRKSSGCKAKTTIAELQRRLSAVRQALMIEQHFRHLAINDNLIERLIKKYVFSRVQNRTSVALII